ncbi:MAG TPA: hypothetical protein PKA64_06175 [Myxococcota bacterium]|nr:hypothetical protein [Myxococcota bacterium]
MTRALLLLCPLLAACGRDSYLVYSVALAAPTLSDGCWYPSSSAPPDEAEDASTARTRATWVVFEAPDDRVMLDVGDSVLDGAATDAGWAFASERVDVQFTMPDGTGDRYTTTVATDVAMAEDHGAISGTFTQSVDIACSGATCGQTIPPCTTTTGFAGSRVEDVELDVALATP